MNNFIQEFIKSFDASFGFWGFVLGLLTPIVLLIIIAFVSWLLIITAIEKYYKD